MLLTVLKWIVGGVHLICSLFLILVVLLQAGKEGLGGLLGAPGGSSENVHIHSRLNRLTTYCAVAFLITTISLGAIFTIENKQSSGYDTAIQRQLTEEAAKADPQADSDKAAVDVESAVAEKTAEVEKAVNEKKIDDKAADLKTQAESAADAATEKADAAVKDAGKKLGDVAAQAEKAAQ